METLRNTRCSVPSTGLAPLSEHFFAPPSADTAKKLRPCPIFTGDETPIASQCGTQARSSALSTSCTTPSAAPAQRPSAKRRLAESDDKRVAQAPARAPVVRREGPERVSSKRARLRAEAALEMAAHGLLVDEADRRERNRRGEYDSLSEFFRAQAEKYAVNAQSRDAPRGGVTSCAFRDERGFTCFASNLLKGNLCRKHYDRVRYEKRLAKRRASVCSARK